MTCCGDIQGRDHRYKSRRISYGRLWLKNTRFVHDDNDDDDDAI
jgi:hypothetical protein